MGTRTGQDPAEDPPGLLGPRSHRESNEVARKLARLREPHVAPLTAFVERLRVERGGGEAVPWFDPAEAGTRARILILLEAPGPRATGPGGPRPASAGSGIISPDNDDQSAANMWHLLREAGIERARDVVTWNVVGWYVGDGTRIRAVTVRDMDEARESLRALIRLLPNLRVVVLLGRKASRAWARAAPASGVEVVEAPHPSPRALNGRPDRRRAIFDALLSARAALRPRT
jgi:hypothetical protein